MDWFTVGSCLRVRAGVTHTKAGQRVRSVVPAVGRDTGEGTALQSVISGGGRGTKETGASSETQEVTWMDIPRRQNTTRKLERKD